MLPKSLKPTPCAPHKEGWRSAELQWVLVQESHIGHCGDTRQTFKTPKRQSDTPSVYTTQQPVHSQPSSHIATKHFAFLQTKHTVAFRGRQGLVVNGMFYTTAWAKPGHTYSTKDILTPRQRRGELKFKIFIEQAISRGL